MTQSVIEDVWAERTQENQRSELLRLLPLIPKVPRENQEAVRVAWNTLVGIVRQHCDVSQFSMTVVEFVANKFVPEHVALKGVSGRIHYQAILRHVLTPQEVDLAFGVNPKSLRKLSQPVPDWPYLSKLRLCEVHPEHVRRLTTSALNFGYSSQTVRHIRSVISAVFSHAKRELCFVGDNPATSVRLPEVACQRAQSLSVSQIQNALRVMKYPEREMALCAAFAKMTAAEISGLQWKHINLTEESVVVDGVSIPPKSFAVSRKWRHGTLQTVKTGRNRILPIPEQLFDRLVKLQGRAKFTGPDDFVLASTKGTPVNQKDIVARRLRPIAKRLGLPALSLQALRRTTNYPTSAGWSSVA